MATTLTERRQKEDTQTGIAVLAEREEKYRASEETMEGPTSP